MAAQAYGTGSAARAQIQDAAATSAAFEYNARVEQQRQGLIADKAKFDEGEQRRLTRMMLGQSIARAGGSGLKLSGQRADIINYDAVQAQLDAMRIRENAKREIQQSKAQETFDRFQAKQATKQGKKNARATIFSGAFNAANTAIRYGTQQGTGDRLAAALQAYGYGS
jgi:hypothetical protein